MYTKYYSKRAQSPIFTTRSTSSQHFYNPTPTRTLRPLPSSYFPQKQCHACKYQSQKSSKNLSKFHHPTTKISHIHSPNQQYYKLSDNSQLLNIKKSKRYLQQLLQSTAQRHKQTLLQYQTKLQLIQSELSYKDKMIQDIKKQYQNNLLELSKQYNYNTNSNANANQPSLINTYLQESSSQRQLRTKNKQLTLKLNEYQIQIDYLKKLDNQNKNLVNDNADLQQRVREYQLYKRQYQAMRILINKIQNQKDSIQKQKNREYKIKEDQYKLEIVKVNTKNNQYVNIIQQKDRQIHLLSVQIQKLKEEMKNNNTRQYQQFQELIQEKDEVIDKLEYKIRCIQSDINFIKNKYGHLMIMARGGKEIMVEDSMYGIERVSGINGIGVNGFNVNGNTRESMLGMNISPIRKR